MQRQFPLNDYIKAVEILAQKMGRRVEVYNGKKNAIRFEVFPLSKNGGQDSKEIIEMWTIHTSHNKKRTIWSREDYRKPDRNLCARQGEFMEILENI